MQAVGGRLRGAALSDEERRVLPVMFTRLDR